MVEPPVSIAGVHESPITKALLIAASFIRSMGASGYLIILAPFPDYDI
jgi:hypothetical protein